MTTTARREGDMIVVRIPIEEAQSLRVALQPCPCKHPKSAATARIRDRFVKGLGMCLFPKLKKEVDENA